MPNFLFWFLVAYFSSGVFFLGLLLGCIIPQRWYFVGKYSLLDYYVIPGLVAITLWPVNIILMWKYGWGRLIEIDRITGKTRIELDEWERKHLK